MILDWQDRNYVGKTKVRGCVYCQMQHCSSTTQGVPMTRQEWKYLFWNDRSTELFVWDAKPSN